MAFGWSHEVDKEHEEKLFSFPLCLAKAFVTEGTNHRHEHL